MLLVLYRLQHGIFVLFIEIKAGKINHQKSQIVGIFKVLVNLADLLDHIGIVNANTFLVNSTYNVLFKSNKFPKIVLGEISDAFVDQLHVYLVAFHHLLILWHGSNDLSHVLKTHVIRALAHFLLALSCYLADLLVKTRVHFCDMFVPESYPEIILIIQRS